MAQFEIRIAPSAMAEIQRISRWWVRNRRASPRLFDHELATILDLLEIQPDIGKAVTLRSHGDVRVVVLRRSRYLVAYRIIAAEQQVWIVRVRHASRQPRRSR
jgi:plasmid stabilization system protein ParE